MREKKKRSYTEAQARAQKRYMAAFEQVVLRLTKEQKIAMQSAAAAAGESMNAYALTAIEQRMEREKDNPV